MMIFVHAAKCDTCSYQPELGFICCEQSTQLAAMLVTNAAAEYSLSGCESV